MEDDMRELKSALRALAVSKPVQLTLNALLRDFRSTMGSHLPIHKYGYRDALQFLKDHCGDCFLGSGPNTVLIPIIPDSLKHIHKQTDTKPPVKSRPVVNNNLQPNCQPEPVHFVQPLEFRSLTILDKWNSTRTLSNQDKENQIHKSGITSMEAYKDVLRKRLPVSKPKNNWDNVSYADSGVCTSQSDLQTNYTTSSNKHILLEELKAEVTQLVLDSPNGVLCKDLTKLYRSRYGRELRSKVGYICINWLTYSLRGVHVVRCAEGTRLLAASASPAAPVPASPAASNAAPAPSPDEDALPWVDYDPEVFPADCISLSESIPTLSLEDIRPGDMLEVMVGEVYSPSHFWTYRLGDDYDAMEEEITEYNTKGEGAGRSLALGAVQVGYYCSSKYERYWCRSVIVKIEDSDTVKVRHVDYGTVDRVASSSLKPLLRRWAQLPAQGLRSRLAGVRPAAGGRRWPHAASAAFLRLVQDRKLVGNVVAVDRAENILELFLVDKSTGIDVRLDLELIHGEYAEPRAAPPVHSLAESWLYPSFSALEAGATPNFGDISAYLRDGIALDFVQEYRDHVPAALLLGNQPMRPPEPVFKRKEELELEPERKPVQRAVSVKAVPSQQHAMPVAAASRACVSAVDFRRVPPAPPAAAATRATEAVFRVSPVAVPAAVPVPLPRPARAASPLPLRAASPLPLRAASPLPLRAASPLPLRAASPLPLRAASPLPLRAASPLPLRAAFPLPLRAASPLPLRAASPLPLRAASPLPLRAAVPGAGGLRLPAAARFAFPVPPAPPVGRRITTSAGEVTLSVWECQIFDLLCSVDPNAAHWYIMDAIRRASLPSGSALPPPGPSLGTMPDPRLNPLASEFRLASTTQTDPATQFRF